jgi:hypothetical protein
MVGIVIIEVANLVLFKPLYGHKLSLRFWKR